MINYSDFAPGDFNNDTYVDGDDLTQWEGDYGVNGDSDANGDGNSNGADFLIWQRQYTGPPPVTASSVVPEPASLLLLLGGWLGLALGGRKQW